jgi:hypothetical protein
VSASVGLQVSELGSFFCIPPYGHCRVAVLNQRRDDAVKYKTPSVAIVLVTVALARSAAAAEVRSESNSAHSAEPQPASPAVTKDTPTTTTGTNDSEASEPFQIGPLVGVGFPRPLSVEAFAKFDRWLGAGFEYGFLPNMTVANVEAGFTSLAGDLRVFPFRGGLFIGARVGRQWLNAKTTMSVGPLGALSESVSASTWFVNPRVGFLYTFKSGVTVGIDAGVQVPISPSYERTTSMNQFGSLLQPQSSLEETAVAVVKTLGNGVTPTIDLLRLGYLF